MIHLRGRTSDVVVDVSDRRSHGRPLGRAARRPARSRRARSPAGDRLGRRRWRPLSIVPEHGSGFTGRPGLLGHRRRGTAWAPRFSPAGHELDGVASRGARPRRGRRARAHGHVRSSTTCSSCGPSSPTTGTDRYLLDALTVTLPVPQHAGELGTFDGRWTRELHPVRRPWPSGAHIVENRRGRTSHEHPPLLFAGTPGYGEWHGVGVGRAPRLERQPRRARRPAARRPPLRPARRAAAPRRAVARARRVVPHARGDRGAQRRRGSRPRPSSSTGTCGRAPTHPTSPRPVLVNTWEAVYFDHDLDTSARARRPRRRTVGVERFVLDDGWFGSRRDDRVGPRRLGGLAPTRTRRASAR